VWAAIEFQNANVGAASLCESSRAELNGLRVSSFSVESKEVSGQNVRTLLEFYRRLSSVAHLMVTVKFVPTKHAKTVLKERKIDIAWCEQVLNSPERVEPDSDEAELEHRLGRISEHGGRVLRVVVNKTARPIRVVTLYFDRAMLRKL